jgi:hypothetical protein
MLCHQNSSKLRTGLTLRTGWTTRDANIPLPSSTSLAEALEATCMLAHLAESCFPRLLATCLTFYRTYE